MEGGLWARAVDSGSDKKIGRLLNTTRTLVLPSFETRETHKPFLSRERFPLDWAVAEMTKQFSRNKRKHAVRRGYIGNRVERKREREKSVAEGSNKRRKTSTPTTHGDWRRGR
jgi:hypothetical protein